MESELYEAAVKGDVPSLLELLGKDVLLLDRIMVGNRTETPLHVAAMLGHLEFVEEILARKAELAKKLDSQSSTPLHLASAKGYCDIVAALLRVRPDACYVRDKYGRNPLHVAAMKGHVGVLELLAQARPDAARCFSENDQTILHLCVKHNRSEALKFLIGLLGDDRFMNLGDADGNTILHLAAVDGQTKTINFLIDIGVDPNITNSSDFTALALLTQRESMERASGIAGYVRPSFEDHNPSVHATRERKREWQDNMCKMLMVVAALLAVMAFRVDMAPPNGALAR